MLILKEFQLKDRVLRNRIVMPAMHLGYSEKGKVTDRLIEFYKLRAEGGVGLIIVGGCRVDEFSGGDYMLSLKDDSFIEGFKKLTSVVKSYGSVILAQLFHAGRYVHSFHIGNKTPLSSSAVRSRFTGEVPKEMTIDEIKETQDHFVEASLRAIKVGFDGVELIGSAGYLISQFLSPSVNKRKDRYGGSRLNRFRFLKELILKIREGIGDSYILGVRLSGNEYVEGGGGVDDFRFFVRELDKLPVDYISVTGGWHEAFLPQITYHVPSSAFSYLGRIAKAHTNKPVILSNRINKVEIGETLLKEMYCDLVAMGRALVADPFLPRKIREGKPIIHCIACTQGCFDNIMRMMPVECSVRPEIELGEAKKIEIAKRRKRVVVVGGGPSGLRASLTLFKRGHEVLLFEKEEELGGMVNYISKLPHKREYRYIVEDLKALIKNTDIKVYLGREFKEKELEEFSPDSLVIATGSIYPKPNIKGIDKGHVFPAIDILKDRFYLTGKDIVIIGGGGVGLDIALKLALVGTLSPEKLYFLFVHDGERVELLKELCLKGNLNITIVEKLRRVGRELGPSQYWIVKKELEMRGVNIMTGVEVEEIRDEYLLARDIKRDALIKIKADMVIYATGVIPNRALYDRIKSRFDEIYLIGDAEAGKDLKYAISSGEKIARII